MNQREKAFWLFLIVGFFTLLAFAVVSIIERIV